MANKQMPVMTLDGTKVAAYITMAGNMANIVYFWCASLVPIAEAVVKDSHYKVNLLHFHKMEYRANLSISDRVVGESILHWVTVELMV